MYINITLKCDSSRNGGDGGSVRLHGSEKQPYTIQQWQQSSGAAAVQSEDPDTNRGIAVRQPNVGSPAGDDKQYYKYGLTRGSNVKPNGQGKADVPVTNGEHTATERHDSYAAADAPT